MIIKYFIYQTDHFYFIPIFVSFISLLITRGTQYVNKFLGDNITTYPFIFNPLCPNFPSLPSLGDLSARHQHVAKCAIDSLHEVYAPQVNPYKVATDSYQYCCASLKRSDAPLFFYAKRVIS